MSNELIDISTQRISAFEEFVEAVHDSDLIYMAGKLDELKGESRDGIVLAVGRAMQVCYQNNIPLYDHFKSVFISSGDSGPYRDWKLSPLGRLLVIINGDPENHNVGRTQLQLIMRFLMKE